MGDHKADFVKQFHALEGDTINDRKKNFNKLLRNPIFSKNKQEIHDILTNFKSKTYLESIFYVDALIYFRHTTRLLDILKEGNETFISKILKQNWFWLETFRQMDADHLVNVFLPNMSFAIRMKVLKKLSLVLNEKKMDEIFTSVYKRYGIWVASKILHTCSKEKIKSVFDNEEIVFRVNQVLHLFNRDSELFEMYLVYYKNSTGDRYFQKKVNDYAALKNPELLLKLEKEGKIMVLCLGRRTSKKTYDIVKDTISQDFDKYTSILNNAILVKKMGSDFKNVYFKKFPRKIEDIGVYSDCRRMLHNYPKNKRWELFTQAFQVKFPDKDIKEVYLNLGKELIWLHPGRDVVVTWADYMYQKENDEKFLKYLDPPKAIPIIKEKINVMSDNYKRSELVSLLLETCNQNKDLTALEEVLKYVCFRHRNEDINFRQNFLSNINNNFKLKELNETHWKYINEQLKILKVKNEFSFWRFSVFLRRYLEFLVKTGKDFKDNLYEYVTYTFTETNSVLFELKNPDVERKLVIESIKIFPDALKTLEATKHRECHFALINSIIKFSEEYPDHFIDIGDYDYLTTFLTSEIKKNSGLDNNLYRVIENLLRYKQRFSQTKVFPNDSETVEIISRFCNNDGYYVLSKCIKNYILKKNRNNVENQLLASYFATIYRKNPDSSIIDWFLRNDPKILIPHFSLVCSKYLALNNNLLKRYSHFNFDKEVITSYKERLASDNLDYHLVVVETLRDLLPTSEFSSIVDEQFIPKKSKLDLEDADMMKVYNLQCSIAKKLHRVEEPLKILPVALKFCTGDYWQSALPSIQGLFYNSPENEIYFYIKELSKKAVSVRKHAVFLGCELLKRELVVDILATGDEENVSNQKHLFSATLKYFKKNSSQELLDLVVKNMSTIDKNDSETLDSLVKTTVSKRYKGFYIEKCWDFYESLKSDGINVDSYLENLLQTVLKHTDVLVCLTPTFVEDVINNYFCTSFSPNVTRQFLIEYLVNAETSREKFIVEVLKKLRHEKKNHIKKFIGCAKASNLTREFMILFAKHWKEHFSFVEAFEEHLMIDLLLIDILGENVAEKIINYMEEIVETFTFNAINLFVDVFGSFVARKKEIERYELFYDLVKTKPNSSVCILILCNICPIDDNENEHFELYQSIIECIKNVHEPIVTIYYKRLLANNNLE